MAAGGKDFVGPYRLFHLIRAGATYEIWAVRPLGENVAYAMKWLPPGKNFTRQATNDLKHEYTVGKNLVHRSIIRTLDFGTGKDGSYLTMELFKTPNLKQQINEGVERLHYRLEDILTEAALAVEEMHKAGWTHRDIKPDNFLVSDENEVRLIDFTIARRIPKGLSKLLSGKAPVQGTYSYMSPEQIRGKEVDARADIYSFGCMVYELMTGKLPFTASSSTELLNKHLKARPQELSVLQPNVQADFGKLVHRMLAKEPADRPESLMEFYRELKAGRCFYIKPKPPLTPEEEAAQQNDPKKN
ncbi:MAG: serine/threonine protein kinase [Planctomycetales bacterium]|nr:serine/threonine protein kinase [Planctomycetales bacterium]